MELILYPHMELLDDGLLVLMAAPCFVLAQCCLSICQYLPYICFVLAQCCHYLLYQI